MWPEPGRTKKLIVAFQFQFANQAAWKCDQCRRSGLEKTRRCGWIEGDSDKGNSPVWARNGVAVATCPVSSIEAQSLTWIEEYVAWRTIGGSDWTKLPARTVDAFCVLEREAAKEKKNGER